MLASLPRGRLKVFSESAALVARNWQIVGILCCTPSSSSSPAATAAVYPAQVTVSMGYTSYEECETAGRKWLAPNTDPTNALSGYQCRGHKR